MLRYVIGITLITIAIIAIRFFAQGKISKRVQYALWLLIPLYMAISPVFSINVQLPAIEVTEEMATEQEVIIQNEADTQTQGDPAGIKPLNGGQQQVLSSSDIAVQSATSKINIDWSVVAKTVNTIVVCSFIVAIAIYNIGFMFFCRKRREFIGVDSQSTLKVYKIDHAGAPFLMGKDIYLSESVAADENMSHYAVCHESCHYKHGDTLWAVVRFIVLAVNWYNPIIWCAFVMSQQDCELACDESVMESVGGEKGIDYGRVLIALLAEKSGLKNSLSFSTAMNGRSKKFMKSRIENIKKTNKYTAAPVIIALTIALAATGCSLMEFNREEVRIANTTETESTAVETMVESEEEQIATIETVEAEVDSLPVIYGPAMGDFEDGYYTVIMYAASAENDSGESLCYFAPWEQIEVNQEYIDRLTIGDVIDLSDASCADYQDSVVVTELSAINIDEFYIYGTHYTGELFYINSDALFYFAKVNGTGAWRLFTANDIPVYKVYDCVTLPVANDYTVYDGFSIFAFYGDEVAQMAPDEIKNIREFNVVTNPLNIETIQDFMNATGFDGFERTVIEVRDNQVINVWFWYMA